MSQSLTNILIHVVFSTKNRECLIDQFIEPELYAFLISLAAKGGNYVHSIGGVEDHLHLCVEINKTLAMSEFIEEIKKNSSRWIKTRGSKYSNFTWQKGYGGFSISPMHKDPLNLYIANQKKHHKTVTFQDEFRSLLEKNETKFDERYVWD